MCMPGFWPGMTQGLSGAAVPPAPGPPAAATAVAVVDGVAHLGSDQYLLRSGRRVAMVLIVTLNAPARC